MPFIRISDDNKTKKVGRNNVLVKKLKRKRKKCKSKTKIVKNECENLWVKRDV